MASVAGPLFIGSILIQGKTLRDYSSLRHPVSSLSLGPRGWMQIANFAVTGGSLPAALSSGFPIRSAPRSVPASARSSLAEPQSGSPAQPRSPPTPVSGYPPGTPDVPARPTAPRQGPRSPVSVIVSIRTRRSVRPSPAPLSAQRARLGNLPAVSGLGMLEHTSRRQHGLQPEGGFC